MEDKLSVRIQAVLDYAKTMQRESTVGSKVSLNLTNAVSHLEHAQFIAEKVETGLEMEKKAEAERPRDPLGNDASERPNTPATAMALTEEE